MLSGRRYGASFLPTRPRCARRAGVSHRGQPRRIQSSWLCACASRSPRACTNSRSRTGARASRSSPRACTSTRASSSSQLRSHQDFSTGEQSCSRAWRRFSHCQGHWPWRRDPTRRYRARRSSYESCPGARSPRCRARSCTSSRTRAGPGARRRSCASARCRG